MGRKHLKPGDLMFFGPGGSQHVSMYIGKGKMIHATNPRSGVRIDSINMGYYKARYAAPVASFGADPVGQRRPEGCGDIDDHAIMPTCRTSLAEK